MDIAGPRGFDGAMDAQGSHDEDLDSDGQIDATISVTSRQTHHEGAHPGDDLEVTTVEEVDLDGDGHADLVATTVTTYLDLDGDGTIDADEIVVDHVSAHTHEDPPEADPEP